MVVVSHRGRGGNGWGVAGSAGQVGAASSEATVASGAAAGCISAIMRVCYAAVDSMGVLSVVSNKYQYDGHHFRLQTGGGQRATDA